MTREELQRFGPWHMMNGFWAGVMFCLCLLGLFQDYMGLEGYIRIMRTAWLPWYISTPIHLALIAYGVWKGIRYTMTYDAQQYGVRPGGRYLLPRGTILWVTATHEDGRAGATVRLEADKDRDCIHVYTREPINAVLKDGQIVPFEVEEDA